MDLEDGVFWGLLTNKDTGPKIDQFNVILSIMDVFIISFTTYLPVHLSTFSVTH